jgi:hypothetical protein
MPPVNGLSAVVCRPSFIRLTGGFELKAAVKGFSPAVCGSLSRGGR